MTNVRRIMKVKDFSHAEPSIFLEKQAMKSLAKLAKKRTGQTHSHCLFVIANIFCGVNNSFAEYWEEGIFDLQLEDAIENHPDIVTSRFKAVAEFCQTSVGHIKALTGTKQYDSIIEN